jgi:hypothetical protein
MRTTLKLDEDVLDKARALATQRHLPFRAVVNEALRLGLAEVAKPARQRPYRTRARPLGLRKGHSLDNISDLLAQAEGEDYR